MEDVFLEGTYPILAPKNPWDYGIFTYIEHQNSTIHVGKYTSPMDPIAPLTNPSKGFIDLVSLAGCYTNQV